MFGMLHYRNDCSKMSLESDISRICPYETKSPSDSCKDNGKLLSTFIPISPPQLQSQVSVTSTASCSPGLKYRNLGKTGLKVSAISLGTWVNFGSLMSEETAEEIVTAAFENGINTFDTGDIYAAGRAEKLLGKILKKKGWKRSSYIVMTKLFWGTRTDSEKGLSRKWILEGLQASLERLKLDYVDIMYINKADPMCPMEEIVRACTYCINNGMAMYWGSSRWTAMEVMEAYAVARQCNLIPPSVEQTEYHMFHREKVEIQLPELYHKIGVGTVTWSPQAFGILSGKLDEGIHLLSRGSVKSFSVLQDKNNTVDGIKQPTKNQELNHLAHRLGCSSTQLTLAWCLKCDNVHSVLIGASSVEQLYNNLLALQVLPKLTTAVIAEIEKILDNKPVRTLPPKPPRIFMNRAELAAEAAAEVEITVVTPEVVPVEITTTEIKRSVSRERSWLRTNCVLQ